MLLRSRLPEPCALCLLSRSSDHHLIVPRISKICPTSGSFPTSETRLDSLRRGGQSWHALCPTMVYRMAHLSLLNQGSGPGGVHRAIPRQAFPGLALSPSATYPASAHGGPAHPLATCLYWHQAARPDIECSRRRGVAEDRVKDHTNVRISGSFLTANRPIGYLSTNMGAAHPNPNELDFKPASNSDMSPAAVKSIRFAIHPTKWPPIICPTFSRPTKRQGVADRGWSGAVEHHRHRSAVSYRAVTTRGS